MQLFAHHLELVSVSGLNLSTCTSISNLVWLSFDYVALYLFSFSKVYLGLFELYPLMFIWNFNLWRFGLCCIVIFFTFGSTYKLSFPEPKTWLSLKPLLYRVLPVYRDVTKPNQSWTKLINIRMRLKFINSKILNPIEPDQIWLVSECPTLLCYYEITSDGFMALIYPIYVRPFQKILST